MVSVASLWLPVLLSAVFVFIASSIIHMVLRYHKQDKLPLPNETSVMDALRPFKIPPGNYIVPHANNMKEKLTPEYLEKTKRGPVVLMTVLPNGPKNNRRSLWMWFAYAVLVSVIAGYVTGLALGPGADYRVVFRIVSTVAFTGYALAILKSSTWWYQSWGATLRTTFDGLVYALLTGGTFGWLWPNA